MAINQGSGDVNTVLWYDAVVRVQVGCRKTQLVTAFRAMFDASLEDLIWSVDTNPDFRIVQFRVYARP